MNITEEQPITMSKEQLKLIVAMVYSQAVTDRIMAKNSYDQDQSRKELVRRIINLNK